MPQDDSKRVRKKTAPAAKHRPAYGGPDKGILPKNNLPFIEF
jgi:hypothetical protein